MFRIWTWEAILAVRISRCSCIGFYHNGRSWRDGNNQEFLHGEKVEQEIAEGCRRLIKNAIVCWNYMYLSQRIVEEDDLDRRQDLIAAIRNGSVVTWQHINVHGEYDFSDEKLKDSVGLRVPKILELSVV